MKDIKYGDTVRFDQAPMSGFGDVHDRSGDTLHLGNVIQKWHSEKGGLKAYLGGLLCVNVRNVTVIRSLRSAGSR